MTQSQSQSHHEHPYCYSLRSTQYLSLSLSLSLSDQFHLSLSLSLCSSLSLDLSLFVRLSISLNHGDGCRLVSMTHGQCSLLTGWSIGEGVVFALGFVCALWVGLLKYMMVVVCFKALCIYMMVDFRERETDPKREIEIDFFRFSVLISGEGRCSPYIFFFYNFFYFLLIAKIIIKKMPNLTGGVTNT